MDVEKIKNLLRSNRGHYYTRNELMRVLDSLGEKCDPAYFARLKAIRARVCDEGELYVVRRGFENLYLPLKVGEGDIELFGVGKIEIILASEEDKF